ncbi:MAG: putative soluble pyridine nucleotide transhydrogenase [Chlamydiae bacterium]|nr:putative soluble pyridine nucleotide transhydrogenase [Chlamydiota bacterium]
MENIKVDVLVVGSGPAGQKAAIQAAKLKKSVVIIEKEGFLGGACLHSGTIPSKTLRASILDLSEFYLRSFYSKEYNFGDISINDLNFRLKKVIEAEIQMIERQFKKNKIQIIFGNAQFENERHVSVLDSAQTPICRIESQQVIIASGSAPRNPNHIPFDGRMICDSSSLLKIEQLPKKMIVLGGGVIGSEYASFFAALGTHVVVIDKKDHMLPYLDREIGMHLQSGLSNIGLEFHGNKQVQSIEVSDTGVSVHSKDGGHVEADLLLYALGREANIEGLHIENANLSVNNRGYIEVNEFFQTTNPNIYAVGDVVGGASLASTSMEQGRLAALKACGIQTHHFPEFYPLGIYTIPEISSCGLTEDECKKQGLKYEVGRAYYYEIAASHIYGSNDMGMFKIIFDVDNLQLLGVHIVGRNASEVIHIGQMAMMHQSRVDFFTNQVFNYPTFAEGYRIAALNGLNKVGKTAS